MRILRPLLWRKDVTDKGAACYQASYQQGLAQGRGATLPDRADFPNRFGREQVEVQRKREERDAKRWLSRDAALRGCSESLRS